ncbi:MFS transporter [Streptomyces finlayi]|uniref:MFS transporter n=1 Tax=Streptomyces finlayi TaxID=67296 RepID=UPI0034D57E03
MGGGGGGTARCAVGPAGCGWRRRPSQSTVTADRSHCCVGGRHPRQCCCAFADSLPTVMAGRLLVAAGASQFTPHASSLAAALAPKGRSGKSLALVTTGLVMGSVVGVPSGTWVADIFGWRTTLAVLAAGHRCRGCASRRRAARRSL